MKIAIQGHSTRGNEVIQILESLGGKNCFSDMGFYEERYYYITSHNIIIDSAPTIVIKEGYKIYTLEEFEKEFPFKVGDIVQTIPYGEPGIVTHMHFNPACTIAYRVRYNSKRELLHCPENLKFYKEMEERNITLTLEKAKEWYKKGGELREIALQAFKKEELNSPPRSWEEFCKNGYWHVGYPEKYKALFKLEKLRDCWIQGWEPEWNNEQQSKYCIGRYQERFKVSILYTTNRFLSFPTKEMAEEFLKCFRDLIEKAGDLI